MKKTVALLLTVLMLLGILPLAVSASNGTDAGIINNFKGIIDLDAQKDSAYEEFGLRKEFTLHEDVNPHNPLGDASGTIWWLFSEDYTKLNVFVEATDTDFDDKVGDTRVFRDYIKNKRNDINWNNYSPEDYDSVHSSYASGERLMRGTPPYDNALDAARNDHQSYLFWHVDGIELFLDPHNKYTNLGDNESTVDNDGGAFHYKADIHGNKYAKIGPNYYFDADCDKYFDVRVNVVRNANDNGGTYTMEFVLDMTAYQQKNGKINPVTVTQGTTMGVAASLVDHCWVESTNYINDFGGLASEERWMVSSTYMEGVSTNTSTKSLPAAHPSMTAGGSVAFPDCGDGNHTYDNGRVTTAATCQSNGVMTYTCKLCGDSYTQPIEKDPDKHTYNFDFAYNFAKENTNANKKPYQDECNTYVLRIDIPATCEDDGWGKVKCRYCDHSEEMALPAIGHVDRTKGSLDCTSEFPCLGSAWTVKRCKNYNRVNVYGYKPDEHETEQEHGGNFEAYAENGAPTAEHTPAADWTIKKNHKDSNEFTHTMVRLCTVCGTILEEKVVPAGGDQPEPHEHTWGDFELKYDDCAHGKVYERRCTVSGCEATDLQVDRAPGHDLAHHDAKAQTCTEAGWDAYDTCTRCDYTTKVEKPALGHDLAHHAAKPATCTEAGYKAYDTCNRCDYTTYEAEDALGHDIKQYEAKAPSCTEAGWDAYEACTRCDYTTKVEKPALGHDPVHHDAKAPSCTEAGWDAYDTCTRCDYTTKVEKPALGHVPGEWIVEKEATETEDGYRYKKCTVCEEKVAEEVIPRLAWVNPFEDVPEDKWFYASVKYANQNNLFKGTSDTTFEPNTPMNRAMFCRVLANLEGVDNDNNLTVDRFSDVLSGKWYTKAVKWAADTGIVSGYPGGIFLPEQKITRQEMCLMLANYAKYLGIYDDLAAKEDNGVAFADTAKIATWASEAVNVMKNNGYIVGKPIDGTYEFQPQATATRAEVATIFRAFCMANPTVLKK